MSDGAEITIDQILGALEQGYAQIKGNVVTLSDPLSTVPDEGGWTIRQLLSHLIGALQRVPVHAGFFLNGDPAVPITMGDDYWIDEWATAPLISFQAALDAAYLGTKGFIGSISAADLNRSVTTPFGSMSLSQFLMVSVNGHIAGFHGEQLAAFTEAE